MESSKQKNVLADKLQQNGDIYRAVCAVFGVEAQIGTPEPPRAFRYYDQYNETSIDLLTVPSSPRADAVSYSTLGLTHYPVGLRREELPLRIELAAACYDAYEYFPNLLSSCAFDIMSGHVSCREIGEGVCIRECVNTYVPGATLPHLVLLPAAEPIFWPDPLPELTFEDKRVVWLQAIPVSDGELEHYEQFGAESLLTLLEDADLLDLERTPVL